MKRSRAPDLRAEAFRGLTSGQAIGSVLHRIIQRIRCNSSLALDTVSAADRRLRRLLASPSS